MDPLRVLIVDDDASSRRALELCLRQIGHEPLTTEDGDRALEAAEEEVFDVALVDLRLDGASGLDVIEALRERAPWIQAVVVTAHGSIESAVRSVRKSAVDYLTKPVDPETLDGLLRRLSSVRDLEQGLEELREEMDRAAPPPALQAVEPAMLTVYDTAKRAAETDATILIRGESGTGKGVLARAIHQWSPRVDRPFSTVSAPSLSPELLESELFGHVKGAFTGAVRSRPGRIARARGGTLFLDEIGELPLKLQPKLLRVLQERRFERVGSDKTLDAEDRGVEPGSGERRGGGHLPGGPVLPGPGRGGAHPSAPGAQGRHSPARPALPVVLRFPLRKAGPGFFLRGRADARGARLAGERS